MKKLILYILSLILIVNIASIRSMDQKEQISLNEQLIKIINKKFTSNEDEMIKLLQSTLDMGADINYISRSSLSGTPLTTASLNHFPKVVNYLLSQPKIDVNIAIPYHENRNALMMAIAQEKFDLNIINILLNSNIDINAQSKRYKENILNILFRHHYKDEELETLIDPILKTAEERAPDKYNEFINNADMNINTPLKNAIHNLSLKMVKKLLENGADPNIPEKSNAYRYVRYLLNRPGGWGNENDEAKTKLLAIEKLLQEYKKQINQQITDANIFGESYVPEIIEMITDYVQY